KGTFFTLREAARQVQDGGRIVAISTGGTKLFMAGGAAYLGSKGACEQFVRTLGYELAERQVTVNAVFPGFSASDLLTDEFRGLFGRARSWLGDWAECPGGWRSSVIRGELGG